jgi:c-di-GMP-binding flagellar brake protein YcgR
MPANLIDELFYPGATIQIEFRLSPTAKQLLLTSVDSLTDDVIKLLLPLTEDDPFTPVPVGTKIVLSVREKKTTQIYYYTAELLEHCVGNPSLLVVRRPSPIQFSSRRNFFRCEVDFYFYYRNEEEYYRGQAVNLSASGLYGIINCNPHLSPGGLIQLEIPLFSLNDSGEPLTVEARIIRIEQTDRPDQSAIAVHFHNPPEKAQNLITKYLFQRQRELIQKGMIKIGRI